MDICFIAAVRRRMSVDAIPWATVTVAVTAGDGKVSGGEVGTSSMRAETSLRDID